MMKSFPVLGVVNGPTGPEKKPYATLPHPRVKVKREHFYPKFRDAIGFCGSSNDANKRELGKKIKKQHDNNFLYVILKETYFP